MYKIIFSNNAEKEYRYLCKANRAIFEKIRNAIMSLATQPAQGKPLRLSLKGKWSYRVGVYRIIYSIEHHTLTVYVLDIGHRREIYR